jgi:hypothetical protein
MKTFATALALSIIAMACQRHLTRQETEKQLMTSFYNYLIVQKNYDPAKVKFDVKSVAYYEDKDYYVCQFQVNMKLTTGLDTTGTMQGRVSKDFTRVNRYW